MKGKGRSGVRLSKTGSKAISKPLRKSQLTFKSGLEEAISRQLEDRKVKYEYEKDQIRYTVPSSNHVYTPDFSILTNSGKSIIIETKGIWDYDDRYKHLLIRQQHPELDIRFVFQRANSRIKRGSTTTYRDICEGRGRGIFRGYTWPWASKRIPEAWFEE